MLIIGAKGFAKDLFCSWKILRNISFYDDVNKDIGEFMFDRFPILKNEEEAKLFFRHKDNKFTLGLGSPRLRYKLYNKFRKLGGEFSSTLSPLSEIGNYDVEIGTGTNILANALISNSVTIGRGGLIYFGVIITHDCEIGDFVEISPNATVLGNVRVGSFTTIGSSATILPKVRIGKNVLIGAGAVVTKDIPDNTVVMGIPAKVVKELKPLEEINE